jgi:peptidoglycan/xylan/chitin deacetylase (PgdA/CDA1 family)
MGPLLAQAHDLRESVPYRSSQVAHATPGACWGRMCRGAGLLFLLLAAGFLYSQAASTDKTPPRLIAVGDVHGDFDGFCLILKRAGLVDEQHHWIGGQARLVQTGDLLDRGPKGREAMDLLMNILGDLRYVTPPVYASFAGSDSEKRRKDAYQQYAAWYARHAELLVGIKQSALVATEEAWMANHPAGFLEHREAFGPGGAYGKWLRRHATVVKIGSVLLLHGGIHPNLVSLPLEQVNTQVQKEIEEFDKIKQDLVARNVILPFFTIQEAAVAVQAVLMAKAADAAGDVENVKKMERFLDFNNWLCMRDDGPLWFRGYDQWSEEEGIPQIERVLIAYQAGHVVAGHTVQRATHIRSRFEGRVFLIDTGMLSSYWPGGRASALEVEGGKFTARYLDGQEVLFEEKPATTAAGRVN